MESPLGRAAVSDHLGKLADVSQSPLSSLVYGTGLGAFLEIVKPVGVAAAAAVEEHLAGPAGFVEVVLGRLGPAVSGLLLLVAGSAHFQGLALQSPGQVVVGNAGLDALPLVGEVVIVALTPPVPELLANPGFRVVEKPAEPTPAESRLSLQVADRLLTRHDEVTPAAFPGDVAPGLALVNAEEAVAVELTAPGEVVFALAGEFVEPEPPRGQTLVTWSGQGVVIFLRHILAGHVGDLRQHILPAGLHAAILGHEGVPALDVDPAEHEYLALTVPVVEEEPPHGSGLAGADGLGQKADFTLVLRRGRDLGVVAGGSRLGQGLDWGGLRLIVLLELRSLGALWRWRRLRSGVVDPGGCLRGADPPAGTAAVTIIDGGAAFLHLLIGGGEAMLAEAELVGGVASPAGLAQTRPTGVALEREDLSLHVGGVVVPGRAGGQAFQILVTLHVVGAAVVDLVVGHLAFGPIGNLNPATVNGRAGDEGVSVLVRGAEASHLALVTGLGDLLSDGVELAVGVVLAGEEALFLPLEPLIPPGAVPGRGTAISLFQDGLASLGAV